MLKSPQTSVLNGGFNFRKSFQILSIKFTLTKIFLNVSVIHYFDRNEPECDYLLFLTYFWKSNFVSFRPNLLKTLLFK